MFTILTEDHTVLYSSATSSIDFPIHMQPLIAFAVSTLKDSDAEDIAWETARYRCTMQQVDTGQQDYNIYVFIAAPRSSSPRSLSLRGRILFAVLRAVLEPHAFLPSMLQSRHRLSQSHAVLTAIVHRVTELLEWEPALYWPLPLALPSIDSSLLRAGVLCPSLGEVLEKACANVMARQQNTDLTASMIAQDTREAGSIDRFELAILQSVYMVLFIDTQLLDVSAHRENPMGPNTRDFFSHADYITLLAHSELYGRLQSHALARSKAAEHSGGALAHAVHDGTEAASTTETADGPGRDESGCIIDRFLGSDSPDSAEDENVAAYFAQEYHIINVIYRGQVVKCIVVGHCIAPEELICKTEADNLRMPVFSLFYCVPMTGRLSEYLTHQFNNNMHSYCTAVARTLVSECHTMMKYALSTSLPLVYVHACHPLKAFSSQYIHAATDSKLREVVIANHTTREVLTHSLFGTLEDAVCVLSRHSSGREEQVETVAQDYADRISKGLRDMQTGVQDLLQFRYSCLSTGCRFVSQRRRDRLRVFWVLHIQINKPAIMSSSMAKSRSRAPRPGNMQQDVLDCSVPGAQTATSFSVLRLPITRQKMQELCLHGTHASTNGYCSQFSTDRSRDIDLPESQHQSRRSMEGIPRRTPLATSSLHSSQHSDTPTLSTSQLRAGSNRRSLLNSALRRSALGAFSTDVSRTSDTPLLPHVHLIEMVASFRPDVALEDATCYMVQLLDQIVRNQHANSMLS